MKITILGSGSSAGVPMIGQKPSSNPKNVRTRVSCHIKGEKSALLIDTSPDLRQQCLENNIKKVDGILYTHAHSDHLHGIDDTRAFNHYKGAPIDCYSNAQTLEEIRKRFGYCFQEPNLEYGWYRPCLIPHEITPMQKFQAAEFEVLPFRQFHIKVMDSIGYRINGFAYSTDVKRFPKESEDALYDLDLWVIDCLNKNSPPTHLGLEESLEYIEKFKPKRAILTHMNHTMDYDKLLKKLPKNVEPAFDGMVIEL